MSPWIKKWIHFSEKTELRKALSTRPKRSHDLREAEARGQEGDRRSGVEGLAGSKAYNQVLIENPLLQIVEVQSISCHDREESRQVIVAPIQTEARKQ